MYLFQLYLIHDIVRLLVFDYFRFFHLNLIHVILNENKIKIK